MHILRNIRFCRMEFEVLCLTCMTSTMTSGCVTRLVENATILLHLQVRLCLSWELLYRRVMLHTYFNCSDSRSCLAHVVFTIPATCHQCAEGDSSVS